MKATITDLRYRMKDVLRAIDRGETVTVLYRGKEKATLSPIAPPFDAQTGAAKIRDQPFFGMWSDRDDLTDPASYVRNVRHPRPVLRGDSTKKQPEARKRK